MKGISEAQEERNEYIVHIFRDLKRSGRFKTVYDISEYMALIQVDRHYMSEERAAVIYRKYFRDGKEPGSTGYKRIMYMSFIEACKRIRREGKITKPFNVMYEALNSPARCLGISPYMIRRILKKAGQR